MPTHPNAAHDAEWLASAAHKSSELVAAQQQLAAELQRASAHARQERGPADQLKVLELFAGIGGMRCALRMAHIPLASVVAVDTSPVAGVAYLHNRLRDPFATAEEGVLLNKNIEALTAQQLDAVQADLWTMSPPCQPFTTTANAARQDCGDLRCAALTHLSQLLPVLQHPPRWILLENVKGFADSAALRGWARALEHAGFSHRSFLLSPSDLGIPNQRARFYMVAERGPRFADRTGAVEGAAAFLEAERLQGAASEGAVQHCVGEYLRPGSCQGGSQCDGSWTGSHSPGLLHDAPLVSLDQGMGEESGSTPAATRDPNHASPSAVSPSAPAGAHVSADAVRGTDAGTGASAGAGGAACASPHADAGLAPHHKCEHCPLYLSREQLRKPWARGLSVVSAQDTTTFCFTSGYGKVMHKSSGSLLLEGCAAALEKEGLDRSDMAAYHGRLRLFSPAELLSLFGFPTWFGFPALLSLRQQWKLIGQSVSVPVVARVARFLLEGHGTPPGQGGV